jgi:hypothetical protein
MIEIEILKIDGTHILIASLSELVQRSARTEVGLNVPRKSNEFTPPLTPFTDKLPELIELPAERGSFWPFIIIRIKFYLFFFERIKVSCKQKRAEDSQRSKNLPKYLSFMNYSFPSHPPSFDESLDQQNACA